MAERTFKMSQADYDHYLSLESKSAKIRYLDSLHMPRADIARELGIVYQFVKNVLDGNHKGGSKSKTGLRIVIVDDQFKVVDESKDSDESESE